MHVRPRPDPVVVALFMLAPLAAGIVAGVVSLSMRDASRESMSPQRPSYQVQVRTLG